MSPLQYVLGLSKNSSSSLDPLRSTPLYSSTEVLSNTFGQSALFMHVNVRMSDDVLLAKFCGGPRGFVAGR